VVLPGDGGYKKLIGIPLSLPMGWTYSLPYFCVFAKMATDIINAFLDHQNLPWHPLEQSSQNDGFPAETQFHPSALLSIEPSYTMRSLLHSVDAIFYDTPATTTRKR
jgi:hypothetical protein